VFFVDPENGNSSLQIFFDLGTFRPRTVSNLRSMTIESLATTILNQRMTTLTYQPQASSKEFGAYVAHDYFPNFSCSIAVSSFKEGKALEATKELIEIVKQFADYGISEDELAWAKKSIISQNEFLIANANTLPHEFFQSRLGKHFTTNDHLNIASIPATANLENELLSTIEVDDVTAASQALFDFNKSIYLFSFNPEAYAAGGIENEKLLSQTIADCIIKPTEPYKALATGKLITMKGTASGKYAVADVAAIEAKKIVMGNGITIYYKQTNFSEDGINIAGFAPGGLDAIQENPLPGKLTCSAIAAMGIGGIKPYQWATILNDKPNLSVDTSINLHGRIVTASSRKEDLLFCFNIILATMLEPNTDQELFELFTQNTKEAIKEKQNIPMRLFQEKNSELNFGHTTLFHSLTEKMIDRITLNDVLKIYKSAFTNVGEFTFTISGNVSLEELMPVLDNTLGLLPASKGSAWQALPVEVNFPAGASRITFDRKSQQQTMVSVSFPFTLHVSLETERILELYKHILQMRLTEALRFETGKTYAQSAYSSNLNKLFVDYDDTSARLQFSCSCSNQNVEATTDIIIKILQTIKAEGFTTEEIAQAKKIAQNNLTQAFKSNDTWNDYILDRHLRANDLFESVDTLSQHIENTTPEKINTFAKKIINPDHYLAHSLISESTQH
jgi:zinc protease